MRRFLDTLVHSWLPDGINCRLHAPFRYETVDRVITVPDGFVTDLASTPRELWPILPPFGRYAGAAVIHDRLYWTHETSRDYADDTFREAMTLLAVPETTIALIYAAVREFGQAAWDRNAQLRAAGYTRIATGPDLPPYAGPITQPIGDTNAAV